MIRTKADELALQQGCYYDEKEAEKPVRFAERFFRSQFIRGKFTFLPWQANAIRYFYGWRLPNGNRRFRLLTILTPKKSGKTLVVCAVAMYELLATGEPSPFLVSCAPSRENASQVYDELAYALEHSPFAEHVHATPHIKRLKVRQLNAEFRSLASDGKRVHGYNASVFVDEAHEVPSALWNALRYAADARPNGFVFVISTAGQSTDTWFFAHYQRAKRVLAGEDTDITHAAFVYEHDPSKPYDDEDEWRKANPSIYDPSKGERGSFPLDQFRRDHFAAKEAGVAEYLNFLRLKQNLWLRAEEAQWLDVTDYEDHTSEPSEDELKGCTAAIGVDLSEAGDPSSVSVVWHLGDNRYHVRSWGWVCKAGIHNRARASNLPRYDTWTQEGSLQITDGDMIDARVIRDHIIDLCQRYDVRSVNFDPRGAYSMGNEIAEEGYATARIPQNFRYFTPLLNEFGKAWREKRVTTNGSQWLRYCLGNVRIETNRYDECRPYRKKSVDHIDGAISTLLAFHSHIAEPTNSVGCWAIE